jgi:hypothetical protein
MKPSGLILARLTTFCEDYLAGEMQCSEMQLALIARFKYTPCHNQHIDAP